MHENVVNGLKTYSGRDAMIRVVAYFALFMYGVIDLAVKNLSTEEPTPFYFYLFTLVSFESLVSLGQSCRVIAKQFSTTRLITRFFDDAGAMHSLYIFWNKNFPDEISTNVAQQPKLSKLLLNWMTVFNLLFWVLYNPFEHIAYLGELKVIDVDHNAYYDYTNVCWAGALATSVLLNLRMFFNYFFQQWNKANIENDPTYNKSELISLSERRRALFIAFRDFLDLCMALNYMPQEWLPWENRLYHYQIGLLGVVSSLCRIYQYLLN